MVVYDFLRIIFIIFIISLGVVMWAQRKNFHLVNGFTVIWTVAISIFVSGISLIVTEYIADELNLAGDLISFFMFLVIVVLSLWNGIIYYKQWFD